MPHAVPPVLVDAIAGTNGPEVGDERLRFEDELPAGCTGESNFGAIEEPGTGSHLVLPLRTPQPLRRPLRVGPQPNRLFQGSLAVRLLSVSPSVTAMNASVTPRLGYWPSPKTAK